MSTHKHSPITNIILIFIYRQQKNTDSFKFIKENIRLDRSLTQNVMLSNQ